MPSSGICGHCMNTEHMCMHEHALTHSYTNKKIMFKSGKESIKMTGDGCCALSLS